MSVKKKKRVRAERMSPSARRDQILDSAAALILERGMLNCSLEETAVRAGISKPLIYRYFTKRDDLLKELLAREYSYLCERGVVGGDRDSSFEPMVQNSFRRAFEYLYERGPLLPIMTSDPSVRRLVRTKAEDQRRIAISKAASRAKAMFGVPDDVALVATMISANAPIISARSLKEHKIAAKDAADVWAEFTLGGWRALSKRFAAKRSTGEDKKRLRRAALRTATKNVNGRRAA